MKKYIWMFLFTIQMFYGEKIFSSKLMGERKITLEEALDKVMKNNYDSQLKVEQVYQAHHNVNIAIGRLLPSLNYASILSISLSGTFEVTASTLGFFFPSNWFNWKENSLYFKAEQTSYATLLANIVNLTESIYYKIQLLNYSRNIILNYIERTKYILDEINHHIPNLSPFAQAIYETKNHILALKGDLTLINNTLRIVEYEFLFTLGENPDKWKSISLEPFALPDPSTREPWKTNDFLTHVYSRSQELQTNRYLIEASKYSTYSRYFNFVLPSSSIDSNLGFGYISQIKIGKSRVKQYKIMLKEMKARIRLQVEKAVQNYNRMLIVFLNATETKRNGELLVEHLLENVRKNKQFDDNYVDGLSFAFKGEVGLMQVKHAILTLDAQKKRLLWNSERYKNILNIALKQKHKKGFGVRKYYEEIKIKKNFKNKKPIVVPTIIKNIGSMP